MDWVKYRLDKKEDDLWLTDAATTLAAMTNPHVFYHGRDVYEDSLELKIARKKLANEIDKKVAGGD